MSEEHLNEELAAVEAALASVGPRPSRLDRDRVMFLAGRASAAPQTDVPPRRVGRWAWPAAFCGMTALAASLLVMLAVRQPEPKVVERTRPGPAEAATERTAGPDQKEVPVPPGSPRQPASPREVGGLFRPDSDRDRFLENTPYFGLLDQMLALGPDSWTAAPRSPADRRQRSAAPMPYHDLLNSLLDVPATSGPPWDRPDGTFLLKPGVKS